MPISALERRHGVLDKRQNGAPPREINKMVSVQDRELFKVALLVILDTDLILNPADEAFASKYMPDLGYDMKDFKSLLMAIK